MRKLSPEKKKERKVNQLKRLVNIFNRKGDRHMEFGKEKKAYQYYEAADRFEERLVLMQVA